ncbi:unnamed protein product [Gongylonema pulchrum]|uniref:GPI ethanolamine phosphate transferase 2 n=1 Tax=Gongylonema pulchrum TaxID=637853 RepID=A0A183DSZ2_9BILA|nr:unnamed protein product [Gongylonema pulchrum]
MISLINLFFIPTKQQCALQEKLFCVAAECFWKLFTSKAGIGCPKSLVKKPSAAGPGGTKMALTAGVVPSFTDIVLNFATTSISNDNIIDQLKGNGYRLTFCGDETWLQLFPGRFDNHSVGTTSFYVNDYKEALTAGVVPSFVDIVLNFATTSISNDNIIDQLKGNGYRLTFCGDETWLQLFPGRFDNHSVGTTSFYVNDYKEVDEQVTQCMNEKLQNDTIGTWDLMILHYLGLDHIGHSLSGMHSEISNKLVEMDTVIAELYRKLHEVYQRNFYIIVLGDHGMTEGGSHGVALIEQVDIVPTLASLFDVRIPNENLGVTMLPRIATDPLDPSVMVSLLRNSQQFQDLGKTFLVAFIEQVDIVPTLASLFDVRIPNENLGVTMLPRIATEPLDPSVMVSLLQNSQQFQDLGVRKYCTRDSSLAPYSLVSECSERLREIQAWLILLETNFDNGQIMAGIALSFSVSLSVCVCVFFFCNIKIGKKTLLCCHFLWLMQIFPIYEVIFAH